MKRFISNLNNVWDVKDIALTWTTTHKQRKVDSHSLVQGDELHVFWNLLPESKQAHQQQVWTFCYQAFQGRHRIRDALPCHNLHICKNIEGFTLQKHIFIYTLYNLIWSLCSYFQTLILDLGPKWSSFTSITLKHWINLQRTAYSVHSVDSLTIILLILLK